MDDRAKYLLENRETRRAQLRQEERAKSAMMHRLYKFQAKQRKENTMKTLTATVNKRPNSPDFVIGSFGFKAEDLVNYCNSKGYINFDILKGKESGEYVKVSDYGVEEVSKTDTQEIMKFDDEEIPF